MSAAHSIFFLHGSRRLMKIGLCCALSLITTCVWGQQSTDTSNKVKINIINAAQLNSVQEGGGSTFQLIKDVVLQQGDNMLYCDTAFLNQLTNNLEAYGSVRIVQPGGTEGTSNYLRYTGNDRKAFMYGNVSLTDGKDNLWSTEVEYDVATKVGVYKQGGTLQSGTTTLSSNSGVYNMKSKDAQFTGEVYVTDPQYEITSENLGYNTETKVVTFFAPSIVTSDSSILRTSCGTYDTKSEIAHFPCRSSIINKEQFVDADSIYSNRKTGLGKAVGNVVAIDTSQNTTLYSGRADYNEKKKTMLATIKPVLKQVTGEDSLFIRADTLYSAPIPRPEDTMMITKTIGKGKNKTTIQVPLTDSIAADSSRPRYFIGYHNVLIFSDSLQGKCDSISYSQEDSVIRMMYTPIAWSRNSQITGDTILLYMDSNKLKKMYVPNNGFMVSQSGPPKANFFDQVQGRTITGYFKDNAITDMLVIPDAEAIHYPKDDNGAYTGVVEAQADRMRVFFEDRELSRIFFGRDNKQKNTPLEQADIPSLRLKRFSWQIEKRPRTIQDLFE